MSSQLVMAAQSAVAELLGKRAKFDQKRIDCENMAAAKRVQLTDLEAQHKAAERDFICGKATIKQVQDLRKEVEKTITELAECERLTSLAAEAIEEIDTQILQAEQAKAAAQREFCTELRNQAIAKIKADKPLRQNLMAAMVANAGTGGEFTFRAATFFVTFVHQLLPEINEAEVRAELEKFNKSNELD